MDKLYTFTLDIFCEWYGEIIWMKLVKIIIKHTVKCYIHLKKKYCKALVIKTKIMGKSAIIYNGTVLE